ncbi:hypothetical protein [uncultured Desulfovibrio sp.]|uniref:hypothetical protein n=1 Tax=uncultured Desulfovibrio sp. TaxID=167968 RepID=UPI00260ED63D|nr:hypothetical protein [uncultured Desulfovibrio sp.]
MKKIFLIIAFVPLFIFNSIISVLAFEIYGYWKSDEEYPLNIIAFDNLNYYYGKYSQQAKFSNKENTIYVQFTKFSALRIVEVDNDHIKVTFPDPSLPKDIIYKRINENEAKKILAKY